MYEEEVKNESKWGRQCEGRVNEKIDYYFCFEKGNEKIERHFKQRKKLYMPSMCTSTSKCTCIHTRVYSVHMHTQRTIQWRAKICIDEKVTNLIYLLKS